MKLNMEKIKHFLLYFIPLFAVEALFRLQANMASNIFYWMRSLLFVAFLAAVLFSLNERKRNKLVSFITLFVLCGTAFYAFFQVGIQYYYGYFFSIRFAIRGTPNVGSYTVDFLSYLKPQMFLFIIIALIGSFCYFKFRPPVEDKYTKKENRSMFFQLVGLYASYILFLFVGESPQVFEASFSLYMRPYYPEVSINQLGMTSFILTDFQYIVIPDGGNKQIVIEEPAPPVIEEPANKSIRIFDDSTWLETRNQEENELLVSIDNYFLGKSIAPKNDATGKYENMNFVYILTEAFDMIAIDKDLTPTLYKMKQEGTYFENFYSPQFNCATAESELISLTSVYPVVATCTMSAYYERSSPQTIFNLFKDKGYSTSSYHNWDDEFYPRNLSHPFLGSDKYMDLDDLIPTMINGWQSDLTMMEGVVKELNAKNDPYMAYVITSSTHLPYDSVTELGTRYLDQINQKYPDAPDEIKTYLSKAIELDHALNYLLTNLDDIDNTVIAMFADHRPLKMKAEYLNNQAGVDRLTHNEIDHTPFIIYTPQEEGSIVSKAGSTIDMAPTIANLFNLNYDPRLYMGTDFFSDEDGIVIFQNGSWYDKKGYYNSTHAEFTPYDENNTYSVEEISAVNEVVKNKLYISSIIYTEEYFKNRPFIDGTTPSINHLLSRKH